MKKYCKFLNKKILIVNKKYGLGFLYRKQSLNKELIDNFKKMQKDALKYNINLFIDSGLRGYSYQKKLYNSYKKIDKEKADTYIARPGHSEHQTGLAIDIVSSESKDIKKFKKEFNYLHHFAYKYGFILRYPDKKMNITKYKYEPWHYRYVGKELATILYNKGAWITLEEFFSLQS